MKVLEPRTSTPGHDESNLLPRLAASSTNRSRLFRYLQKIY